MGESNLPHSVHEKELTVQKLCVRLVHRPKVKSREGVVPRPTHQNPGFVRSLVKMVGTVAYVSNRVEHASAVRHHT